MSEENKVIAVTRKKRERPIQILQGLIQQKECDAPDKKWMAQRLHLQAEQYG